MCKDIKSLDTAKRNLTFSITALKKIYYDVNCNRKIKRIL